MKPRVKKRIGALILGSLLAFCLGELAVRTFYSGRFMYYTIYASRPIVYGDPVCAALLAPNFDDVLHNFYIYDEDPRIQPWCVQTNAYGWREPEIHKTPEAGERRVMFLGDSVAYGMGVDESLTSANLLRQDFNRHEDQTWSVLNRSVPGWHSLHHLNYFESDGHSWSPELIIVHVVQNDFVPVESDILKFVGKYRKGRHHILFKHSQLLNALRVTLMPKGGVHEGLTYRRQFKVADMSNYGRYGADKYWFSRGTDESFEDRQEAIKLAVTRYKTLVKLAQAKGAKVAFVVMPMATQLRKDYWFIENYPDRLLEARPVLEVEQALKESGFHVISVLNDFRDHQEVLFIDNVHLTAEGHQVVFNRLKPWIDQYAEATQR